MHLEINVERTRSGFRLQVDCRIDVSTTGLFGPSGAGKTTLLHLLAGLDRPDRGRIVLDGRTLCDTSEGVFIRPHKRHVGLVFQDARLFPHLSVRGNLRFAEKLVPKRARSVSLDTIVDVLELGALLDRWPRSLSGGERQRVALARTLLSAPRILLLDEPAAAVDANRANQILPFLKRIHQEIDLPMILVSHRLSQIRYLTDTLLILDEGRLPASGQFPALIDDPEVVRLIGGNELLNVLRLRVAEHRPDEGVTTFQFYRSDPKASAGGRVPSIKGPLAAGAPNSELIATVRPEDVIVSLAPVEYISARNQLPGRITRIVKTASRTLCCVDVGMDLLADVTHISADELDLHPGKKVWCLFKTHAVAYPYGHPSATSADRSESTMKGNTQSETSLAGARTL
ncbi:MAG: molybdenum ABC transporter ATP-binding protein [Sedimentisphaerales bacterium]|nr:molybdenum ABC transporter ATP-binding protein [Sedimentisphaerales bacterium]